MASEITPSEGTALVLNVLLRHWVETTPQDVTYLQVSPTRFRVRFNIPHHGVEYADVNVAPANAVVPDAAESDGS